MDFFFFFFFSSRRRHTRWTGDWSSDVCSSDLGSRVERPAAEVHGRYVRVDALGPAERDRRHSPAEVLHAARWLPFDWQKAHASWDGNPGPGVDALVEHRVNAAVGDAVQPRAIARGASPMDRPAPGFDVAEGEAQRGQHLVDDETRGVRLEAANGDP